MSFGIIGQTCPGMRQVVGSGDRSTERGTFGGEFGGAIVTSGDFTVYMCDSAAMRPSSHIKLRRLVIIIIFDPQQICMLRISWKDHRTKESVLNEIGTHTEFVTTIRKRKLQYFSHMIRV